jgi:hypothetical protein
MNLTFGDRFSFVPKFMVYSFPNPLSKPCLRGILYFKFRLGKWEAEGLEQTMLLDAFHSFFSTAALLELSLFNFPPTF